MRSSASRHFTKRVSGESTGRFRSLLPQNLLIFDGMSPYCVKPLEWMLERNFTYDGGDAELQQKLINLATVHSTTAKDIVRSIPCLRGGVESNSIIFIESVPSTRSLFGTSLNTIGGLKLEGQQELRDFIVSTKWHAFCRVLMKLDRRNTQRRGKCYYYGVPSIIGDRIFDFKYGRRQLDYGRRAVDILHTPHELLGLKERLWRLGK